MRFTLEHGTLDLDRRVFVGPQGEVRVTTTEARLLAHLAARPDRAFAREELQVEVWGYRSGIPSRTVFTTVGRIRQKIEPEPARPRYLVSTDGGYRFVAPTDPERPAARRIPQPATAFVGRERELADLLGQLRGGARLVSMVGPGGIGKTRLGIECAHRLGEAPACDTAFVPLEAVVSSEGMAGAVVSAMALRPVAPGEEPLAALADRLHDRHVTLVLDNVEQIAGVGPALARLVSECPHLVLVVTTRIRLAVTGEVTLWIAPMSVPRSGSDLEATDAGRLVLELARRARPTWIPDHSARQAMAELCRLSDGSPLALELAIAWLRLLEPSEIVSELRARTDLLRTESPDVPARHTSIRAMLDSSFRLLAPESVRSLGGLAVMREPFSREASLHVAAAGLRELGQLVDASMIRRTEAGRFAFHPAVREEAWSYLGADERAAIEARHADFFLGRLSASYRDQAVASERSWLSAMEADHLDLVAAFKSVCTRGRAAQIADHAEAFYRYLDGCNRFSELAEAWGVARAVLEALPPCADRDRALGTVRALEQGAGWQAPDDEPFLHLLERSGGEELARGLIGTAIQAQLAGRFDEGGALAERALHLARAGGHRWLIGFALSVGASSIALCGRHAEAAEWLEEAIAQSARRGGRGFCRPLVHLGEVRLAMGQPDTALHTLARALAACRDADDRSFALLALGRLGQAHAALGGDPEPFYIEAVEEGCAHHVPPYWWAVALVELARLRAGAAGTAGPALAALVALEQAFRLPPPTRACAEEARRCAVESLGASAALGWEREPPPLEQAALALLAVE